MQCYKNVANRLAIDKPKLHFQVSDTFESVDSWASLLAAKFKPGTYSLTVLASF